MFKREMNAMRNLLKTIASICLSVVMISSFFSLSSLAAGEKKNSNIPYKYYTYLGDSISWGYGINPDYDQGDPYNVGARVPGAFTDLVGKKLEKINHATVFPAASSGARFCDYRILLERGMGVKDPYNVADDWYGMRKPFRTERLRNMGPEICEGLSKSDLVTIQLGINDIAGALINAAYSTGIVDIDKLESLSGLDDVFQYLAFAIGNFKNDPNVIGNLTRTFNKEILNLQQNANEVVKDVVKVTPDNTDILVVGYHKAVQGIRVIPGSDYSLLFSIIDDGLETFNMFLATITMKYKNVYYVSAPDASVVYPEGTSLVDIIKTDFSFFRKGVHPDAKGHQYIAKQVLKKLKEINS